MLGLGVNKTGALSVESATPTIALAVVTTEDTPTASSSGTATLSGSYTGSGVTEVGFDFGVNVAGFSEVIGTDTSGTITADVPNLGSLTVYSYRAYAKNSRGKAVGSIYTFTSVEISENTPPSSGAGSGTPETPSGYTLVYTADWSSDTDGWASSSSGNVAQLAGDTDNVSDDNSLVLNNVLEVSRDTGTVSTYFWTQKGMATTLGYNLQSNGKTYIVVTDILVPSSNDTVDNLLSIKFGGNPDAGVQSLAKGEWHRYTTPAKAFTSNSGLFVYGSSAAGTDTDDKYYVGNLWLYESN